MKSASVLFLLALPLIIAAAGVGLRLYMDRGAENVLRPGEDIDLAALRDPLPENASLACPAGYCAGVSAIPAPVFTAGADHLYQSWLRVTGKEPRVTVLVGDPQRRRVVVLQRSAVFRFPDVVIAQIVDLNAGVASILIYSKARYGRADFGVNRARIIGWLQLLAQMEPQAAPVR